MTNNKTFAMGTAGIGFSGNIVSAEINDDQSNESKQSIYLAFAIAGKSATITSILAEAQRQAEEWGNFIMDKRDGWLQVCLNPKLLLRGSRRQLSRTTASQGLTSGAHAALSG